MEDKRRGDYKDTAYASRQLGITNQIESSLARQVPNIFYIGYVYYTKRWI